MIDPAFGLSVFSVCGLIYVVKNRDVFPRLQNVAPHRPAMAEIDVSGVELGNGHVTR
jgi:hypothetical protein